MAKKTKRQPPPIATPAIPGQGEPPESIAAEQPPLLPDISQEMGPPPKEISITVPVGHVDVEQVRCGRIYVSRHVEAGKLTFQQRVSLRGLLQGLDQAGARLASGKRVGTNADVVRWLLEQAGAVT